MCNLFLYMPTEGLMPFINVETKIGSAGAVGAQIINWVMSSLGQSPVVKLF